MFLSHVAVNEVSLGFWSWLLDKRSILRMSHLSFLPFFVVDQLCLLDRTLIYGLLRRFDRSSAAFLQSVFCQVK